MRVQASPGNQSHFSLDETFMRIRNFSLKKKSIS